MLEGPIIFFDGECGLCDGLVQFVLRQDKQKTFRFAPIQGQFASDLISKHGYASKDLDTLYLLHNHGLKNESLHLKSTAVLSILNRLGGFWWWLSLLRIIPKPLRDTVYNWVAYYRYRLFGKVSYCQINDEKWQQRLMR